MAVSYTAPALANVSFSGNVAEYGGNNIDTDPLFTRAPDSGDGDWTTLTDNDYGDLRLQPGSPAVDAGDNDADLDGAGSGAATISDVGNDLADHPRIVNALVDMGAYELQSAELALDKSASQRPVGLPPR
ncbi:MAG TPA: choice-of-anchor Q domain-containing protein [Candidatus Sulfomarinibacteraceae bacterium]|nr:choice-of-anchor Q domain-containing protein [Candidatus Sulfomarinibacteraceae bacterium]